MAHVCHLATHWRMAQLCRVFRTARFNVFGHVQPVHASHCERFRRFAGPGCRRHLSAPAVDELRTLSAAALQRALSAGNIDTRHCIEKKDLAAQVHGAFGQLPLAIRSEITSLVQDPSRELAPANVHSALLAREARLQLDEQYSVRLFRVRPGVLRMRAMHARASRAH